MSQLLESAVWLWNIVGAALLVFLVPSLVLDRLADWLQEPIVDRLAAQLGGIPDSRTPTRMGASSSSVYERYIRHPTGWNRLINTIEFCAFGMRGLFFYSVASSVSPLVGLGLAIGFMLPEFQSRSRYRVRRLEDRAVRRLHAQQRT